MTSNEKTTLAHFLDTAHNYLGSGYAGDRKIFFEENKLSTLPLAYQINENEDDEDYDNAEQPGVLVLIIGKGINTDAEESPFSQKAGQLFEKMLASAGLSFEKNCAITGDAVNDGNSGAERKIRSLKPKAILCLGRDEIWQFRAQDKIPVLFTYHPEELLRDETLKRPAFEDMKKLMACLAGLDSDYVMETKNLLARYAASDPDFASRIRDHLG